ncbi:MAG: hypothetical protein SFY92_09280 [Verrucomicrobiae bacterium]|nr:hypothetical protein [Verrucomicrobiae bacterium]
MSATNIIPSPSKAERESAVHQMARIRSEVFSIRDKAKQAKRFFDTESSERNDVKKEFDKCWVVLVRTGELWQVLKPLILFLRKLEVPAMTRELRYWPVQVGMARKHLIDCYEYNIKELKKEEAERVLKDNSKAIEHKIISIKELVESSEDNPISPWDGVPNAIINTIHLHSINLDQNGNECPLDDECKIKVDWEAKDDKLEICRTEFARFCLERLKIDNKKGYFIEPSPVWRKFYIRAANSLHINPEGRGHHVLYAYGVDPLRRKESDTKLQEEAKRAYDRMRHCKGLPQGLSPRRSIIEAVTQLFEAHLTALGIEVNQEGAARTREILYRRTKESSKGENLIKN